MAELARKTGVVKRLAPAGDHPTGAGGLRLAMTEVTTIALETSGTVTMATDFGAVGVNSASGILTFLTSPVGVTVQQDTGAVVANASVTAAGVVTTGSINAEKSYWVFAFCI